MPDLEKKMRIQLFDSEMNQLADRLVGQDSEFYKGPAQVHQGPIRVEVSLFCKEDVDLFKTYLDKLRAEIPLETFKKPRGRKALDTSDPQAFRFEMLEQIKGLKDHSEISNALRENGFEVTSLDLLVDMELPVQVKSIHWDRYTWMVRCIRKAKNPLNDRYDPTMLVGFSKDKILVYFGEEVVYKENLEGDLTLNIKVPVKVKVKFPDYLNQEERNTFRAEMELLKKDPERQPSRFYRRWVHEVAKSSPEGIEFPKIEEIKSPYTN